MQNTKYEFKIIVNGSVSKQSAFKLAQTALSPQGSNPVNGTSIFLTIRQNGKIVSERGISRNGMYMEKLLHCGI